MAKGGVGKTTSAVNLSCGLAASGIQIVRVHAVGLVRAALECFADARPASSFPT